jgi:PKD repeat protein
MGTLRVGARPGLVIATVAVLFVSIFAVLGAADHAGHVPQTEATPLAPIRIQDRPAEGFATLQAAIDAAAPGDLVLVPASPDLLDPLARIGAATIAKAGVTVCASIAGGPVCAADIERGHWALSRSVWTHAPAPGQGDAMLLDGGTGWGSTSFYPPTGFRAQDLHALTFDFYMDQPSPSGFYCGAGSPRITLGIDLDGDGTRDKNIHIHNTALQSDCTAKTWHYADMLDPATARWDLRAVGGANSRTHDEAMAWLASNIAAHSVTAVNAIVDNGAIAIIDNHRINDWVLGEPRDVECYWSQGLGCRWDDTLERTILEADGAPHAVKVTASDVTLQGLTVRNSAKTPVLGVVLEGHRGILQDSVIAGSFRLEDRASSGTIHQVGVTVARGATDVHVMRNHVSGWSNIGLLISYNAGGGTLIADNLVSENRWHGIFVEGPGASFPAQATKITGNTVTNHGSGALRVATQDPAVVLVRNNVFALSNLNAVTITNGVAGKTVDLRLNDWQVYDANVIATRILDESGSNVPQHVPFIDATGAPEPPVVTRLLPDGTSDVFFTVQEAVDDAATTSGSRLLLRPARTGYPGGTIAKDGITLCSSADGTACDGDPTRSLVSSPGGGSPALRIEGEDVIVQGLGIMGGSSVLEGDAAHRLVLTNSILVSEQAGAARHGIRLMDSDDVSLTANTITGNLYPGSIAVGIIGGSGAELRDNRILGAGTSVWLSDSLDGMITGNQVATSAKSTMGGDTLGVSLHRGAGHALSGNTIHGAGIGLVVVGAKDVSSEADRFTSTGTGIEARAPGSPALQPDGLQVRNATLVGAATALRLDAQTSGLNVDARCNDWGVYSAPVIQTTRISDHGTGNMIHFTPYIGPASDGQPFPLGCLRLAAPGFSFSPADPAAGAPVVFTDESVAGSRTILEWEWDFGDGTVRTQRLNAADIEHVFRQGGVHHVALTLTDSDGNRATAIQPVSVTGFPAGILAPSAVTAQTGRQLTVPIDITGMRGAVSLTAQGLPATASLTKVSETDGLSKWQFDWMPQPHHAGTHPLTLTATDLYGAIAVHELVLTIEGVNVPQRVLRFAANTPTPGPAVPGGVLTFKADVKNLGASASEVHLQPSNAAGWAMTIAEPIVLLQPGETRTVTFQVQVGTHPATQVSLKATPVGAPDATTVKNWHVRVPVQVTVEMTDTQIGNAIQGIVTVTHLDGSPAPDRTVDVKRAHSLGPGSAASGRTDENGTYRFLFPVTDRGAQMPGAHKLTVDVYSPHQIRKTLEYSTGL